MSNCLREIFEDERLVEKIRRRLAYLFQLTQFESLRVGKIGMQVGDNWDYPYFLFSFSQ